MSHSPHSHRTSIPTATMRRRTRFGSEFVRGRRRPAAGGQFGFSLLELLVGLMLFTALVWGAYAGLRTGARSWQADRGDGGGSGGQSIPSRPPLPSDCVRHPRRKSMARLVRRRRRPARVSQSPTRPSRQRRGSSSSVRASPERRSRAARGRSRAAGGSTPNRARCRAMRCARCWWTIWRSSSSATTGHRRSEQSPGGAKVGSRPSACPAWCGFASDRDWRGSGRSSRLRS